MKYTAKFIDTALRKYYDNQARYMVSNIYAFHNLYKETDFLLIKQGNNWCYDIEVKVSRGDFSADFNKENKHSILKEGFYKARSSFIKDDEGKRKRVKKGEKVVTNQRPNRFYFAVPENLISVDDVPEYAGLLYINKLGKVTKIKEAKVLHRNVIDMEPMLCRKFYFYWGNAMEILETVKKELKSCQKKK